MLGLAADEAERLAVGGGGLGAAIEAAEEVGAGGVPEVVVGEVGAERVDEGEAGGSVRSGSSEGSLKSL